VEQKDTARNKVILLYIINRLPGLSVSSLTDLSIDTCYMNYFTFAAAFNELLHNKLITKSLRKGEVTTDSNNKPILRCDITQEGLSVLSRLDHIVPSNLPAYLSRTAQLWETAARQEREITATYQLELSGDFTVSLKIHDGVCELVSIRIAVPTKDIAENICQNWKNKSQENYLGLLALLTKG
jgi:hypothetical protein